MHFDPQNIDGSIASLLDGLKTAFITSLVGMGSAILFKILVTTPLLSSKREQEDTSGAGPEDILRALLDQNSRFDQLRVAISGTEETSLVGQLKLLRTDQTDHHKESLRHLNDFRTAVSGTEETSLVGQFKLLRSDEHDRHKEAMLAIQENRNRFDIFSQKLWEELDEFAEMLSKSATEQMMNALKEVIADFNKNLTEQFGENFKALDASVQKLVQWQENYRVQLEQMSAQYAQAVEAITKTEASVAHISDESQQIPVAMEKLKAILLVNQHQLSELKTHLEAFRDMRDKAVEAVPQIREQIEQTIKDVAASAQAASTHYTKLLENSDAYIQAHDKKSQELLDRFVTATGKGIEKVKEGLESSAEAVKTAIMTGAQEFDNSVQRLQGNLTSTSDQIAAQSEKIREQFQDTFKEVNEHVRLMLTTLSDESKSLSKTLKTTGEQVQRDTQETQKQVAESIKQMQSRLESSLNEVFEAQARSMSRAAEGLEEHMKKAILKTGEGVNVQLSAIDQAMQKEIESVMTEMGRALAQIAGQFTQDYMRLVGAMQQVVEAQPRRKL